MDRIETARKRMQALYGAPEPAQQTDPDFAAAKQRLVYGEVYEHVRLEGWMRELVVLTVAVVNQTPHEAELHTTTALAEGAKPEVILEAVYHCAPYIGAGKAEAALEPVHRALRAAGASAPSEPMATVTEADRLEKGLATQKAMFGETIDRMRESAPEDQKHIQDYLSAYCFGDFYTRRGLDLQQRELLTFCILCAQGGCESQLRSHILGNAGVGNGRAVLLDALTACLPYIGFPRTLNALSCINELLPEA